MSYNLPLLKYKNLTINSRAVLAPMAGVTDLPFRTMVRKWAKESLVFTEMLHAEVFINRETTEFIAQISPVDQPIAFQFAGNDPLILAKAAEKAQKSGAVCVDLNLGCPVPKLVKKGYCTSLLRDREKAREIFRTVASSVDIPVTVKIRAGWDQDSIIAKEFTMLAEENGLAAVALHGRTRDQFYQGQANWDYIKEAQAAVSIPVIGSGDLWTPEDAKRMVEYTGCAGVWVARGCLGNPWVVAQMDNYLRSGKIEPEFTPVEKIGFLLEHLDLMVKHYGERIAIPLSRKHIAWGIKELPESDRVKNEINKTLTHRDSALILENYRDFLEKLN